MLNVTEFIHDNIDKIYRDENLLFYLIGRIATKDKLFQEILLYNLQHHSSENKLTDIESIVKFIKKSLKTYQYKIGGHDIEDKEWIISNKSNKWFTLEDNQLILYNTIERKFIHGETQYFLNNVVKYILRHIDVTKFTVKHKIIDDHKHHIAWPIILIARL